MRPRITFLALTAGAVLAFAIAIVDVITGGFHVRVLGIRISSWEIYKPLAYGEAFAFAALWLHDRSVEPEAASWNALARRAGSIVAAIAVAFVALMTHYGIRAAGGADGYGYVSEAALLTRGRLLAPDPLVEFAAAVGDATAPLGYRPAKAAGYLAPVYAPGLPLAMAAAQLVGGPESVYLVVPILGGLVIWLTFALGARLTDRRIGFIAAAFFAFSPLFVFHSLEPMSDVPVTAWWLLAWILALSPGRWTGAGAGVAAAAAILTRPNIFPLAAVVAIVVAAGSGARRALWFAAAAAPAALVIAAINQAFYGSPLNSGYGTLDALFSVRNFTTNVSHFWSWLLELHTPLVLLGLLAPFVARIRNLWGVAAFAVVLIACYVFYLPFDNWTFLRFLLPALPFLFILDASLVASAAARLPLAFRGAVVFVVSTLVPFWFVARCDSLRLFEIKEGEGRYATVGGAIERLAPPDAVIISLIHSGSVRLYGHRATLRFDLIDPRRLEDVVALLRARGRTPYFLLENWEEPRFRDRFGASSALGKIDWPPAAEYVGHNQIRLYAPDDRSKYLEGIRLPPKMIPSS